MLRHAAIAPLAVLASHRHANHTSNAEILVIKLPQAYKLVNYSLLLRQASCLGDITRLVQHRADVEVCTERVRYNESKIKVRMQ